MFRKGSKQISLRKAKKIFADGVLSYKKARNTPQGSSLEGALTELDDALTIKDQPRAAKSAQSVLGWMQEYGKKSIIKTLLEIVLALCIALMIAGVVRQTWFELYEIPTGSMRPTFREKDQVFVAKNVYSINVPFQKSHFYMTPEYIKRGNIVTFTGEDLNMNDVDTTYFFLFPGKKRYVKRVAGLPGDIVYFYGGELFGIDKNDTPIPDYQSEEFHEREYIPFMQFQGNLAASLRPNKDQKRKIVISHMNRPVGTVFATNDKIESELSTFEHGQPESFGSVWGIGNFANTRLITTKELPQKARLLNYTNDQARLYLEIKHGPRLPNMFIEKDSYRGRLEMPIVECDISWIPLLPEHIAKIKKALYTARFFVDNGFAYRYNMGQPDKTLPGVFLSRDIPDGCYEFYNGIAYSIGWGGTPKELPHDHPIYPRSLTVLKTLYNTGIEINPFLDPQKPLNPERPHLTYFPVRFSYFRDGSLYTLGKELFSKDDPILKNFLSSEEKRGSLQEKYILFKDNGPPVQSDGSLDVAFIKKYGYPVPDKEYLLLGDNHAMSGDSRFFGPVPEDNLQGSPLFIYWPFSSRWGALEQPSFPFLRPTNLIVLGFFGTLIIIAAVVIQRERSSAAFHRYKATRQKTDEE